MIWIGVFIATLILELITGGLVLIAFTGGSVVAFVTEKLNVDLPYQIIIFFVVSGLLLWFFKPMRTKLKKRISKTNVDALVDEIGTVTESINNLEGKGAVYLKGLIYSARSDDGCEIPASRKIRVIRVEGVKVIVVQIEN